MKAAVIGLGKIGLPLAVQIAGRGIATTGADINPDVVATINAGKPPFPGEPDLEERLGAVIDGRMFRATTSTADAAAAADVIVVAVPLVVDRSGAPDFRSIDSATADIGLALHPGQLVVYETTLPIGTTRGRFGPALEALSGLTMGAGLLLAFSPERVSSGRVFRDLRSYPKLVGGINAESARVAIDFYEHALEFDDRPDLQRPNGVWDMGSAESAEFVKLAETTYRDVNIALANEFATHAEALGLDVWEIIAAANSQPFSHIHRPGIAVGGHCIPVYPRFYLAGDPSAVLPMAARRINMAQPERTIARLETFVGTLNNKTVAVLGAAYRGGVKEMAFSGVFAVANAIEQRGGRCVVHDPLFDDGELRRAGFEPYVMGELVDAAVVQTDHSEYRSLRPADLPGCKAIIDGRGVLVSPVWEASDASFAVVGASVWSE